MTCKYRPLNEALFCSSVCVVSFFQQGTQTSYYSQLMLQAFVGIVTEIGVSTGFFIRKSSNTCASLD